MFYILSNAFANIKSGLLTRKVSVSSLSNNFLKRILRKMISEGFIRSFSLNPTNNKKLLIFLKYDENLYPVIRDLKVISTSGNRVYFSYYQVLKAYLKGDFYILTTTKGLFTINEIVYNRLNVGGEVILQIFLY